MLFGLDQGHAFWVPREIFILGAFRRHAFVFVGGMFFGFRAKLSFRWAFREHAFWA